MITGVAAGSVETGYTIFVTLRNGVVRVIRDGELEERHITLPAVAVGVAVAGEDFYAAVSSGTLELYTANTGERSGAVMLPSTPVALTTVPHASAALVAVALRDCAVLLFCGKTPISRHETQHVVLGMFGGAPSFQSAVENESTAMRKMSALFLFHTEHCLVLLL